MKPSKKTYKTTTKTQQPPGFYYYPRHLQHLKIDIKDQGQDIKDIRMLDNWNIGDTEQKYTRTNKKATPTTATKMMSKL